MTVALRSEESSKQSRRKEEIIRAAAIVMREKGLLATRLQDVAEHLGVAYTALYHYFLGRDHLAEEVLCWLIERRKNLLLRSTGESELDRLIDFFGRGLVEDRQFQVRSALVSGLPEPNLFRITVARNELRDLIKDLLERGVAEGSIRRCDSLTMANALLGLLERLAFFDRAIFSDDVRKLPLSRIVDEICRILRNGVLTVDQVPQASYSIKDGTELLSFNSALTPELERLDTILSTATQHFNQAGANASIPRIAEELNVSKTVVYQYFMDKQDLLFHCYLRGVGIVENSHRVAKDLGQNPLDSSIIHRHNLYAFHASKAGPFTFLNAMHLLKPQQNRLISIRNNGVRDTSIQRMFDAQASGLIKEDITPSIAQPMFGQILYGLPSWYSAEYPLPINEVCWQTGLLPFIGLASRR
ncbi:MAG: TetR/AcrR family transcriptional regulator [Pseudomonadales bacterium]